MLILKYVSLDLDNPTLQIFPSERSLKGSKVIMLCKTNSRLYIKYTWMKDGLEVATGDQYVIENVALSHSGSYSCQVNNGREVKVTEPKKLEILCKIL